MTRAHAEACARQDQPEPDKKQNIRNCSLTPGCNLIPFVRLDERSRDCDHGGPQERGNSENGEAASRRGGQQAERAQPKSGRLRSMGAVALRGRQRWRTNRGLLKTPQAEPRSKKATYKAESELGMDTTPRRSRRRRGSAASSSPNNEDEALFAARQATPRWTRRPRRDSLVSGICTHSIEKKNSTFHNDRF